MKKKAYIVFLPITVVVLGIIGYLQEGSSFYTALLSSLKLLKVELDTLPANAFIEVARWLGVLFFFGLIYAAVAAVVESGIILAKTTQEDAVAVHGDSIYAQMLIDALGKKGIQSSNKIAYKAPVQVIIFGDDRKALEFYQKNSESLKKAKEVHLCLKMGCHPSIEAENVFITNMSEVRAIDYWRRNFCSESEKIAIVGSGLLAETVLLWGLLTNIFSVDCNNEYFVFGNFEKFKATHGDIQATIHEYGNDHISFYSEDWYSNSDVIKTANRIILCGDTLQNVETALDMKSVGIKGNIHLFAEDNNVSSFVDSTVSVVGTLSKDNIRTVLLMDSIHHSGKLCHATYMVLENGNEDTINANTLEEFVHTNEFKDSWKKLNAFTRGSNFATAIHDPIKKLLLFNNGLDVTGLTAAENNEQYGKLNDAVRNSLQEIEHIRWSRYHLLNNWKKPEADIVIDGVKKAKDPENKLHCNLVAYNDLPSQDKVKDAYYYQTLALRVSD